MTYIRLPKDSDFIAIASLAEQLGYPSNANEIQERFSRIKNDPEHVLLVAENNQRIVGWIHARLHRTMIREISGEIAALVVDSKCRGQGIGKDLMTEAESWISERGVKMIWLSTNVNRTEAHQFYRAVGYQCHKTSHKFEKHLDSAKEAHPS